jgi:hypothetical protein
MSNAACREGKDEDEGVGVGDVSETAASSGRVMAALQVCAGVREGSGGGVGRLRIPIIAETTDISGARLTDASPGELSP